MSRVFGEARADVLVSPECTFAALAVDMQVEPLPALSTADAIRRAVQLGRRAVELEALRQRSATAAWRQCSVAWQAIGDDRRSTMAINRAAATSVRRAVTLSERVQAAVGAA